MAVDNHIFFIEESIKLLREKIETLDISTAFTESFDFARIKTNKSQLPFKVDGFQSVNSIEKVKGYLLEEYSKSKVRKIVPMPGLEASFCYDFSNNKATWSGPMQLIFGWDERWDASFEEILNLVVIKDKQRFQDVSLGNVGKKKHVITEPIILENGNQIIEEYNILYHNGDYEFMSPILLQGRSKLVGINKS